MYEDKFNCSKCLRKKHIAKESKRSKDQVDAFRKQELENLKIIRKKKGCWGGSEALVAAFDSGWQLKVCPGRVYGTLEVEYVKDYQRLRDFHVLPKQGTLIAQDSKWVEAIEYIQGEFASWDKIKNEEQRRKQELKKKLNGK